MANLLQRVSRSFSRSTTTLTLDQYLEFFQYGGLNYPAFMQQTLQGNEENANDGSFEGLIRSAYKGNGIVFACMLARMKIFSEARFKYRSFENGRPGKLFGTQDLKILERPWQGGVTGDLLARAMQDSDLAGNFFVTPRMGRNGLRLVRMRPDWVVIIMGSYEDPDVEQGDLDAELVGYIYLPGGPGSGRAPVMLLPEQVAHFAPIPDPIAWYRGMSWITPIIREYLSDTAMVEHKQKFLERGATPNLVVTMDPMIKKEAFKEWVQMFQDKHEGVANAYRTLYLGAGASITPVGKDFQQMEFAVTQAVGELRICAASGVPPVLVGVTEGIKSATYSNYASAKRFFADATLRPMWRNFASSIEHLVGTPNSSSELWYDDRDIPFLYEDEKDVASIAQRRAATISSLVDAGYTPDSVIQAVMADDFELLKHTGLFSVQLLPPGITNTGGAIGAAKNGNLKPSNGAQPNANTPAKKKTPAKAASKESNGHASRQDALLLIGSLADARRAQMPPSVNVNIHEGAFRSEPPQVNVDARTTIEEGAMRVEAPVTVEPEFILRDGAIQVVANTNVEEGAVRVDSPITVEKTEVRIDEGAVQVPVTVEPAEVNIERGAVQVDANVESPVTIERGAVQVDAPVTVEPTRVDSPVTVNIPESTPALPPPAEDEPKRTRKVFTRDERGLIESVTEEEIPDDEVTRTEEPEGETYD